MSDGGPGGGRARRPRNSAELQEQIRATRSDIRDQVRQTRAQFDEANARLTARSGRNLVFAVGFGVVLGALVVGSLVVWKPLFVLLAVLMVGFGTSELAVAVRHAGIRVPRVGAAVAGVLAVPAAYVATLPAPDRAPDGAIVPVVPGGWLLAVVLAVVVALVWRAAEQVSRPVPPRTLGRDLVVTGFVQLYLTGLGSAAVVLLAQDRGQWWVLSFLLVVIASDVFAYATGLRFGRHKMAPRISPGKTWEGFAGAATATIVLGMVLAPLLLDRPIWFGAVFGAVILLTGTLGDLGESMIKRDIGIKDMSSWLPGHGGILDRIDSVLPSASAALLLFLATS
ncbi:phosphatidate cytidylyltransferase [uncultured Amnibacterium sp.]|uniref:phosphatidate cytidylyltransferase n=1 Tax=uncultured Amnibacterium sp. TaxID=1631851 RepID=UPI0035CBA03B